MKSIQWPNSIFLVGTFLLSLITVPIYIWHFGLSPFQISLFLAFFVTTGLSITAGYHRLFSHLTYQAAWPVRLFTLLFGAAAFENSVLCWAADHRRHHKFVDHDEDPYNISKGFFHAHIGWMLHKSEIPTTFEGVKDLQQDTLIRFQHRYYLPIAIGICFLLPAFIGWLWGGWSVALGGFLIAGVARVVFVNHMTFLINSLSHTWGRQTYSNRCTARDNAVLAWLTFGEGYHNFHHAFQYDYRNGVKAWHFDPTKWCIWLLHKVALAKRLRRVSPEKILLAEVAEQERAIAAKLSARPAAVSEPMLRLIQKAHLRLQQASVEWDERKAAYRAAAQQKMDASREKIAELRQNCRVATARLRWAMRHWRAVRRLVNVRLA